MKEKFKTERFGALGTEKNTVKSNKINARILLKTERKKLMADMVITSSQNQYVSLARSLSGRKSREESRLFRIDGVKLACEAISRGMTPELLILCDGQTESVSSRAKSLYGIDIADGAYNCVTVARHVFEKISEENAPEGIIAIIHYDGQKHRELGGAELSVKEDENVLLLESVRDPQNVGAILRAAAAFSVDRVIMSRDCADIYNSKAVRASMGALFSLNIDRVDSIASAIDSLRASGRRVLGAALDDKAKRLGAFEICRGDCVLIGNEGHGIDENTLALCNESVYIPMSDGVESLNAATAAAVLAWEFFGKNA